MDVSLFELGEQGVLITREAYQPYVVAWNGAQIFHLWKETLESGRFESVDVRVFTGSLGPVSEAIALATAWLDERRARERSTDAPE